LKKNLAILFSGDFPEGNMHNARLKGVGGEFATLNWEVEFISIFPSRYSSSLSFEQKKEWNGSVVRYMSIGTRYFKNRLARSIQIISGHINLFVFLIIQMRRFDVFYVYSPLLTDNLWAVIILRSFGKNVVVDQTELFSSNKSNFQRVHKFEESVISKYSNILVVISEKLRDHYESSYQKSSVLIPIFVDLDRFKNTFEPTTKVLGYIGSFGPKDGVEVIIDGFNKAKVEGLSLKLMGFCPNEDELKSYGKSLGLEDAVHFTGGLAYDEIPNELASCDTLIMNKVNNSYASYGYPWKLGEYFASERVVLMSETDGFANDFKDTVEVLKYQADNSDALASALERRYKYPELASNCISNAKTYAIDHFTSSESIVQLDTAIRELLKE
jgi:glycosyltransferase involved in cell wall biosynthesis